jgi:hypothetical protein
VTARRGGTLVRAVVLRAVVLRAAVVLAAVLCTVAGSVAGAAPALGAAASADDSSAAAARPVEVLVSRDGVHFTEGLRGALITGGDALLPGGAVSADLWVRNPAPIAAALRIGARDVAPTSPQFADAVTLTAWENGTEEGAPLSLSTLSKSASPSCAVLLEPRLLQPGETTLVHLRFDMADVAGAIGQRETAALTLVVAMRDAEAGAFPDAGCGAGAGDDGGDADPSVTTSPADQSGTLQSGTEPTTAGSTTGQTSASSAPGGFLAYTGSGPGRAALLVAALLVGAGAALATSRPRRSRTDG